MSDPTSLHLKKELTQIRKAARLLRDPGTTSSWKSTSRSVLPPASTSTLFTNHFNAAHHPPPHLELPNAKHSAVFLHNWKHQNHKSNHQFDDDADADADAASSSWVQDDSLSDARNGADSKSDTYLPDPRSASFLFRCRDTNLVSPRLLLGSRKKGKRNTTTTTPSPYFLSANQQLKDDSDEDLHIISSGASPLLLNPKLKPKPKTTKARLKKTGRKLHKDDSVSASASASVSTTPALSTSSYTRYYNRNPPSNVGSWDPTTTSFNDGDDEVDDPLDLPARQGCGIPCYWSKRPSKHKTFCRSCCSPSLSDTLRKGTSILCGTQSVYNGHRRSTSLSKKRLTHPHAQPLLPLLTGSGSGGRGGSSLVTGCSDDELSTNFGELDLEALSRLDGRRWSSSCRSQDGLEIVAFSREGEAEAEEEGTPENSNSFSQKYKPMFFDELIGQTVVVHSLANAVSRGRIAPVYLFQGPRGTGKTSTARIFAAALNCLDSQDSKPCGCCRECTDFISGKNRDFWEVDGANRKGIDRVRYLLTSLSAGLSASSSRYKVFVIDECHLLPSKMWLAFLKFLEDPPPRVVFIFITTDPDNVPRTVQSRCQKYLFNKIKDGDIMARLKKISTDENLDAESDALELIALNADGSLRDAETMLDQLSLLGKKITTSLVNELVGVVSDEKLLELLDLAMSSKTAETVKRARELMDSGVDPIVLMSQLASLIMDIIAGTYNVVDSKDNQSFLGGRNLTETELQRLKHALKLLSEAEKQLRVSSERSTWFTATLLQLGSLPSPDLMQSGCSSRRQSTKTTEDAASYTSKEGTAPREKSGICYMPRKSTSPASFPKLANGNYNHQADLLSLIDGYKSNFKPPHDRNRGDDALATSCETNVIGNMILEFKNSAKLDNIWEKCIERCHSKTLRQLLHAYGKLLAMSENEGVLVAYVAFRDGDIKSRAERFLSSITNSIEIVMRRNVEVRMILLPDGEVSLNHAKDLPVSLRQPAEKTTGIGKERKATSISAIDGLISNLDFHQESLKVSRGSFSDLEDKVRGVDGSTQSLSGSPELTEGNAEISGSKESRQEIPMQRIESIICEQRLETAWLQAAEKGTPGSLSHLKPEKNQILPQEVFRKNHLGSINSSQQWEDELNHELKNLKMDDQKAHEQEQLGRRADHYSMSPSLLHDSNFNKESLGYESGSGTGGCSALFCWNNIKCRRRGKVRRQPVGSRKSGRISLFGACVMAKKSDSRFRR
ncbi:hypothetical protein SLA2020_184110 [Shorea laevis]